MNTAQSLTYSYCQPQLIRLTEMADPKQQIMDQVRQQAALGNARALVEVYRSTQQHYASLLTLLLYRNSTNTASSAAYRNQARHFHHQKHNVIRIAWRSICKPGTQYQDSIWAMCRKALLEAREAAHYQDYDGCVVVHNVKERDLAK